MAKKSSNVFLEDVAIRVHFKPHLYYIGQDDDIACFAGEESL